MTAIATFPKNANILNFGARVFYTFAAFGLRKGMHDPGKLIIRMLGMLPKEGDINCDPIASLALLSDTSSQRRTIMRCNGHLEVLGRSSDVFFMCPLKSV